ncbi:MAG: YbaK/EbsC family protein [Acidobacteria bacterium]|nr:YbaK/EbsC family protein [Acidobacteriota bacterium]
MPLRKLTEFLDGRGIKYTTIIHAAAYTAQEIASLAHVRGRDLAKTVIVKVDNNLAMAVLPASYHVDLASLKEATGAGSIGLAAEVEFRERFPDCEAGAMPPFGNLYGLPVYVDESLTKDKEIAFNAGTHYELLRLSYDDFRRAVNPAVLRFAARRAAA